MKNKNTFDILIGSMLLVVVGIMPLVVRAANRATPPELAVYFGGHYLDMFTYWKGLLVYIPAIVIVFFYVSDLITKGRMPDLKAFFKKPHVILSAVYLAFVIISAILSRYSFTAWFGTYHRSEGALMWLSYFVVFFAAIYFSREIGHVKVILFGLAFSSIIMGSIGVSQFIGRDFFATDFAQWLMLVGTPFAAHRGTMDPNFEIAYGTLFNPNTFGKYTAMLSPILLLAALTYNGKKFVNVILLVAGVLMLLGVFGSSSLGGLVGIITAVGVLIVTYLCRPQIPKKMLALAAVPIILVTVAAIMFIPPLNERVNFLFGRMGDAMRAETAQIQNFIFEDDTMKVIGSSGEILSLTVHGLTGNWLTVRDGAGNIIPHTERNVPPPQPRPVVAEGEAPPQVPPVVYFFDIPNYRRVVIYKYSESFMYHHHASEPLWLTLQNNRIYGISPLSQLVDMNEEVPAWGFYGRENWGSNRGYIWSRAFPLMPGRSIIGSGPDTFINVFPKFELVPMHRFFEPPGQIVDKAHNIIIQTWISTGGISAIALIGLFLHYLLTTFVLLVKSKGESMFTYGLRLGLLSGISAYAMSSMATDTTIGSTGVFFVLLGVGYALND
ncbi:MAG: O-antigen ligase family protein [Defluviitaleaceae bacterium]|nr:O-antigen ligase family protein [Defluviitaleaceae bacterium]